MKNVKKLLTFVSMILVLAGSQRSHADFITSVNLNVSPVNNGFFKYEYLVSNEINSTASVVSFDVAVATDADLQAILGPPDWNVVYAPGDSGIVWGTSDPINFNPILPGSTASFSFESILGPTLQTFVVGGLDDSLQFPFENQGQIASPGASAVPEPSTLTLLCVGTISIIAARGCSLRQWFRDSLAKSKLVDSCP